jgi:predicted dehydrogenase
MLKYGVIGYGYWGPNLVRVFNQAEGSSVVTVVDAVAANRDRVKTLYPAIDTDSDARAIIKDPAIDVVVIATPISTHFELTKAALQAGKHVVVEKPLCYSVTEAAELLELAAKKNRQILVDHTFIYTGAVDKIHSLSRNGDLGRILYYDSIRINLGLYQRDASVIWDLAVHDFAILTHVMSERPVAISAIAADPMSLGMPAIAYVTLFFPNDVVAHIHASWMSPVKIRRLLIGGSKSMVVYDDLNPSEKVCIYDKGIAIAPDLAEENRMKVEYRIGDMIAPQIPSFEALAAMAKDANTSFERNIAPLTDGKMGLRVVRLLELADRSARSGGEVLSVENW